jgi:TDG/mug DNA glycosylase family protein
MLPEKITPPVEPSLPDYLKPGLRLVFVGINPGSYSAQVGHYYARPGNLFWWALSNCGLVKRQAGPEDDARMLEEGIGFTDVVKRPTNSSGELRHDEFDAGAKLLCKKIEDYAPKHVCFVGLLGATALLGRQAKPGPLTEKIGSSSLFAIPSPSRRNAHYGRAGILGYFKELAFYVTSNAG